jgi:AraC-like DNA-binding protein
MFGNVTTVEVTDPHQTSRLIWESLTAEEKALEDESRICAREFAAFDWRRFQSEPEDFRSQILFASAGELRATRVVNTRATQYITRPPGIENYCVSLMERGTSRLMLPRSHEPVIGNEETGLMISGEPGTRFVASDNSVQFNLWVPARRIRDRLEVLLDGQNANSFAFQPAFDQRHGPGATIRNMLDFLFVELRRADSLLANEIATRTFEDNLVLCLLLGLPHSHTARLHEQKRGAVPGHIRRAEEFMRANADTPLTITEIAQTAGCSVRALQLAFQQFRGTTPMAALRRIRLEEARTEMLRAGRVESIARIAAGHGFSTPSRFAQLYRRTYGIYPSEALRTQRDARGSRTLR